MRKLIVSEFVSLDVTHAEACEPLPAGDPFGDMMNAPKK
jgi:hypothetical protein